MRYDCRYKCSHALVDNSRRYFGHAHFPSHSNIRHDVDSVGTIAAENAHRALRAGTVRLSNSNNGYRDLEL